MALVTAAGHTSFASLCLREALRLPLLVAESKAERQGGGLAQSDPLAPPAATQRRWFTSHLPSSSRSDVSASVAVSSARTLQQPSARGYKDRKRLYLQRSCTVEERRQGKAKS